MSTAKKDEILSRKKPYGSPSFILYGKVKDLTTGGTGNAQEGSSGQKPRP